MGHVLIEVMRCQACLVKLQRWAELIPSLCSEDVVSFIRVIMDFVIVGR